MLHSHYEEDPVFLYTADCTFSMYDVLVMLTGCLASCTT